MENIDSASIFEIDCVLINYSKKVTCCHFHVKEAQTKLKICIGDILGPENSHMTFISEIDTIFLNYSKESYILNCHFSVKHGQRNFKLNIIINFG